MITNEQLVAKAIDAIKKAYAPYSKFKVGAALLCKDGTVFCGCNVENASYPACMCAERVAMYCAVSSGHRDFNTIAVVSSGEGYCTPCGVCRQVMTELAPDMTVLCANNNGTYKSYSVSELIPHSFEL